MCVCVWRSVEITLVKPQQQIVLGAIVRFRWEVGTSHNIRQIGDYLYHLLCRSEALDFPQNVSLSLHYHKEEPLDLLVVFTGLSL